MFVTVKVLSREQDTPAAPVAIVFGAGLWRNGTPTPILRDRIEVAAQLYRLGKVKMLLLSGDGALPFSRA